MKIVKTIALLTLAFVLYGCEASTQEVSANYVIPTELKDCKFFQMSTSSGNSIIVVRCPNSSTSVYHGGKNSWGTTTTEESI